MTKKQGSGFSTNPMDFVRAASTAEQGADSEMTSVLVRLTKRQKADLNHIADHTPRSSVSSLIRDAIDAFTAERLKALQDKPGR